MIWFRGTTISIRLFTSTVTCTRDARRCPMEPLHITSEGRGPAEAVATANISNDLRFRSGIGRSSLTAASLSIIYTLICLYTSYIFSCNSLQLTAHWMDGGIRGMDIMVCNIPRSSIPTEMFQGVPPAPRSPQRHEHFAYRGVGPHRSSISRTCAPWKDYL